MPFRCFSRLFSSGKSGSALVLGEHDEKNLHESTLHAITAARQVADNVSVLIAGQSCQLVANQAAQVSGVTSVLVSENAALAHFVAENVTNLLFHLQKEKNFQYIISGASSIGKNILPRLAAKLSIQPISDVIKIESADTFVRPIYAGNALATFKSSDAVKVLTIRGTAFEKAKKTDRAVPISRYECQSVDAGLTKWVNDDSTVSGRPSLTSARVVVSGGRALKSGENFKMLEELADKLKGAVGASRAAVDAGYVPNDMQVGQTGKVVAPDIYLAVGISGAIQHLAGMKDSKIIVAINKDPDAPIFQVADYGLVGDLFQIIPQLNQRIDALKK